MEELGEIILEEKMVLEKFDGDGDDRVLREKITLVNNELISHEFFDEEGNPVEGGN